MPPKRKKTLLNVSAVINSETEDQDDYNSTTSGESDDQVLAEMGNPPVETTSGMSQGLPVAGSAKPPHYPKGGDSIGRGEIKSVMEELLKEYLPPLVKEIGENKSAQDQTKAKSKDYHENSSHDSWDDVLRGYNNYVNRPGYKEYSGGVPFSQYENLGYTHDHRGERPEMYKRGTFTSPSLPLGKSGYNTRPFRNSPPRGYGSPRRERSGYQYEQAPRYQEDLSVKVRPFSDRETDWFTYKNHFEAIASHAGWSEKTRCVKLMSALQGSLAGITAGLQHPIGYEQLVERLDADHGVSNDREDALLRLSSCRKGHEETMPIFAEKVRQLVERAYPNFSPRDKDEQALRVFLTGLPSRNDIRLTMKLKDFRSLREAVVYGARLEQVIQNERGSDHRRGVNVRGVGSYEGEINRDDDASDELSDIITRVCKQVLNEGKENPKQTRQANFDTQEMVTKLKTKYVKRTPQNSPCHLCSELGHWANECPLKVRTNNENQRYHPNQQDTKES